MTKTAGFTPDVEAAAERVKAVSERVLEVSKQNGLAWLEAYERVLDSMLKLEQQTAGDFKSDWIATLATTHADMVREMSQATLGALKERLK